LKTNMKRTLMDFDSGISSDVGITSGVTYLYHLIKSMHLRTHYCSIMLAKDTIAPLGLKHQTPHSQERHRY